MEQDTRDGSVSDQVDGEVFEAGGRSWIGFKGQECPEELKEHWKTWHFLRADGKRSPCSSPIPTVVVGLWGRDREDPTRVVGYWYEGAENRAKPKTIAEGMASGTFERYGHIWTAWKKGDPMPAALVGIPAKGWAFLQGGTYAEHAATGPANNACWSPEKSGIIAWRLVGQQAPSIGELLRAKLEADKKPKHQSPSEIKYHAEQAEKKANAAMILADGQPETPAEKLDRLVKEMVGNGDIFAPPKKEVPNLYRVAGISRTGTSFWGAGD